MKNVIISALGAYIFYSFSEVKNLAVPVLVFFLIMAIVFEIDELLDDFKRSVRRGQRLNKRIDNMKGVRF